MAIKKITRRWLVNSFGVILVILVILGVGIGIGVAGYYNNGTKQVMLSKMDVIMGFATDYYDDNPDKYENNVKELVENFDGRSQMELMVINLAGKVVTTSSGFIPDEADMPDYDRALYAADGIGEYRGRINGEKVLAITRTISNEGGYSAIRAVVSMRQIDRQITAIIVAAIIVEVAILAFVAFSNIYFINSIVRPIGAVGDTARKIAQGNFETRIKNRRDDELGELCNTINYMAGELGATEKMKNDFISSISHELRTPLTAIKGWSETMTDSDDEETRKRGMKVITGETERLSHMVEELLDFSRLQSGRLKMMMDKIDIVAEVQDVALMFSERAKREGIAFEYGETDAILIVYGDKNRLRQVFVNIIDNALKYSDAGGKVSVGMSTDGSSIRITVADSGIGISAEDLPNVKRKFYKGNSTRRGSGIGLAMADEIIAAHNGSLDIASEKGVGTTVKITLPLMNKKQLKGTDTANV